MKRTLIICLALSACAPAADPPNGLRVSGAAANTAFSNNSQQVAAQVAVSEHLYHIN